MLETCLVGLFATVLYASKTEAVALFVVSGSALWAAVVYLWQPSKAAT